MSVEKFEAKPPVADREAFNAHVAEIVQEYRPQTVEQRFVVNQIAQAMWRLQRCQRMEDELMDLSLNPFAEKDDFLMKRLQHLEKYRQNVERTWLRLLKRWSEIRKEEVREQKAVAHQREREYYEFMSQERELEKQLFATPSPVPEARAA